jgi:ATP-dependent DNA helicase RecG
MQGKQGTYFVNKVTGFGMDALRSDLIERARKLSRIRRNDHPWLAMSDEEILRSEGLFLTDPDRQKEGVTLAGALLFGTDQTIMSVLPQHKTDAIYRVENLDRYDDRDVIITNLFDSYDRLMAFGAKHLSDPFVLEGIQSISARDKILREIFSNLLAHQDFSSGYVAKFVIEKGRMYTENANQAHGIGTLNLQTFAPFAKNPPISRVFRDAGLADELGSGMRNIYKYTRLNSLYSGNEPQFIEGADIFRAVIPLSAVATGRVGPQIEANHQVNPQVSPQVDPQVSEKVLSYSVLPRSKAEIAAHCGYKDRQSFTIHHLKPLLDAGLLLMTIPDKPRSQNQKYVTAQFGEVK